MAAHYAFLTTWVLTDTTIDAVYDAIYAYERWPEWWRGVVKVEQATAGDELGVGAIARHSWRSVLPYTLHFEIESVRAERPFLLEGRASGELAGTGRWRLYERDSTVVVVYEWNVQTTRAWMNLVAPIARPIFRWNHNWVMNNGGTGLAQLLGAQLIAHA
ncbi:MAG: SRPBCC family protein [Thermoleophilia bacterium]|nr:SRPBCC family protein [Thermoleophilia bacterium]